jgi:DNA-binding NarL/FixJ family response regulator
MFKVLLVDDHTIVRNGLKHTLAEAYPSAQFGEAQNAHEALQQARREKWDIVILDIGLPGRDGLDVLKDLKQEQPKLPVLILSMYPEDQFAVRVLRGGAAGYMTKECAGDELVKAVKKVLDGGKYISSSLAEKLAFDIGSDTKKPLHETLSDREYQVMCRLASGKSVSEVARELSLSVKTISTYRSHILAKLHLKSNAEVTRYALNNRLVD